MRWLAGQDFTLFFFDLDCFGQQTISDLFNKQWVAIKFSGVIITEFLSLKFKRSTDIKIDDANIKQSLAICNQVAPADGHGGWQGSRRGGRRGCWQGGWHGGEDD